MLRIIKKTLLTIVLLLSFSSCATVGNCRKQLDELNHLFTDNKCDVDVRMTTGQKYQEVVGLYLDDSRITIKYPYYNHPSLEETYTKGESLINGDGFKVRIKSNNISLFVDYSVSFDIRDYILNFDKHSNSSLLMMTLDYERITTTIFGSMLSNLVKSAVEGTDISINSVPMYVYFENGVITSIHLAFDDLIFNPSKVKVRLVFTIKSYGDNLVKDPLNINEYEEVDSQTFNVIKRDINECLEYGHGLMFEAIDKTYAGDVPDDEVVACLYFFNTRQVYRSIRFKETTYNKESNLCKYKFAGRTFTFKIKKSSIEDVKMNFEVKAFESNHDVNDTIFYDNQSNRILLGENNSVRVVNTLSFETEHIISLEDMVARKITKNKGKYYISANKLVDSSTVDGIYHGAIYIVDEVTFELQKKIDCPFSPDNLAIDPRGNIAIGQGFCQHYYLSIYYQERDEIVEITTTFNYSDAYVDYDEERDAFLTNETKITETRPQFYFYKNGEYYYDGSFNSLSTNPKLTSFATIYCRFSDFLLYRETKTVNVVNIKDWTNPISYPLLERSTFSDIVFAFSTTEAMYFLGNVKYLADYYYLATVTFVNNEPSVSVTYIHGYLSDYSFATKKDDYLYLFSKEKQEFHLFKID